MKKKLLINVYYDSWCPMCTKVSENIKKLDKFNLITLNSIRDKDVLQSVNIPMHDLEKQMHAIRKHDGKVFVGIDAIASITARIPLWMLIWLPLKLSSLLGFGHFLYNYIAKNRKIVPVGHCENNQCDINLKQ